MANRVYLALGDSMSHDRYPEEDALARFGKPLTALGAASLLCENSAEVWPDFDGKDLKTRFPGCVLENRCQVDATMQAVMDTQLPIDVRPEVWLATLTVSGNDVLELVWDRGKNLEEGLAPLLRKYSSLVAEVERLLPKARLILNTTYDPTDSTGTLPSLPDKFPVEYLHRMNDHIRSVAAATPRAMLADVHAHFLGHGVNTVGDEAWYIPESLVELRARGANEIRRLWWDLLSKLPAG